MSGADRALRPLRWLALAALCVTGLRAQQAPQPTPELTTIRPRGEVFVMPDPKDETLLDIVFLGGVEIERGTLLARGDTLVAVVNRQQEQAGATPAPAQPWLFPDGRIRELFLDGHVTVDEGSERVSGASTWHLDNTTGVATIIEGELAAPTAAGRPPIRARFERLHRLQDGTLRLEGASYTNCSYGHPHWHVDTPWVELRETPEGRVLSTGSNVVRLGDVPVFWLPGGSENLDRGGGFLVRRAFVNVGSRFGTEIGLELGGDMSEAATSLASLLGHEGRVDAEWSLLMDNMTARGFFVEPKLKYETASSKGELFGSMIHDKASTDHLDQPIEEPGRGRIDLTHRTKIDEHQTVDIEVSRESDANYLREYYEREFREEKPQETYVSYRNVVENKAFTALASTRLDDWQNQAEYLPQLVARTTAEPMLGGVLSAKAYADSAKLPPPDGSAADTQQNIRSGAIAQMDWPLDLPNGDRLRATAGANVGWFDDTLDDGSETRWAGNVGLAWSRAFHGTDSAAHSEAWNIEGLRRLAELTVGYFDRPDVSLDPSELPQIDQIDTLAPLRSFAVEWRDRLQTHQDGQVRTILDTDWLLPVFPDEGRDNGGDVFGPLTFDLRWRPGAQHVLLNDTTLRWRTRQDLNDQHWTESYASVGIGLGEGRLLHLSNNAVDHQFDFMTAALAWSFSEKWSAAVFWQQDREDSEHVNQGVILRQLAHCWLVDIEVAQRRSTTFTGDDQDETRVSLRLTPAGGSDEDLAERIGGRYF
jgi:lipopolysaccharide assembly outer membrane protein LptD (OstA)